MHSIQAAQATASKAETYRLLLEQARALIEGERDWIANLANVAALIWHTLPDLNWTGFYLWKRAQDARPHPTARSADDPPLSRFAAERGGKRGEGRGPAAKGRRIEEKGELVLGPFQGKPACVRIAYGKGVCGTAVERRATVIVPDVNQFPGHIVCDSASRSEIVVPMLRGEEIIGVLDVDSPTLARFDAEDRQGLEELVQILLANAG